MHYFGNQSFKKKREKAEKSGAVLMILVQETEQGQAKVICQWRDAERKFKEYQTDIAGLNTLCDQNGLITLQTKLNAATI